MKKLLKERFQELAGINTLAELSPELKARAAMAAKDQDRDQQADRFGKSYGREGEADDSAFKAFIGKELGPREDYMTKISNIDILDTGDGFSAAAYGKVGQRKSTLHIRINYRMSSDSLMVEVLNDQGNRIWDNIKDQFFNRQSIGILKQMIKIANPESKLAKTHWASFEIGNSGVFKESKTTTKKLFKLIKEALIKRKNK